MSELNPINLLYSHSGRQKIGLPNLFGSSIFGWTEFGVSFEGYGIYQFERTLPKKTMKRINFYDYVITHTAPQTTRRNKFADAVSAWQALSSAQKKRYNDLAVGKRMHGYNLFISRYMKL